MHAIKNSKGKRVKQSQSLLKVLQSVNEKRKYKPLLKNNFHSEVVPLITTRKTHGLKDSLHGYFPGFKGEFTALCRGRKCDDLMQNELHH